MITGHTTPHANKFFSTLRTKSYPHSPTRSLHEIHSICGLSDEDIVKVRKRDSDEEGFDVEEYVVASQQKSANQRNTIAMPSNQRSIPFKSLIPVEETMGKRNFEKIRRKYTVVDGCGVKRPNSAASTTRHKRRHAVESSEDTSFRMISPRRAALLERQVLNCVATPKTRPIVIQELDTHGRLMTPRIGNKPKKRVEERIARFKGSFYTPSSSTARRKYQGEPQIYCVDVGKVDTVMRIQVEGEVTDEIYITTEKQHLNGELGYRSVREGNFLACVPAPGTYHINRCQGKYYICVTGSRRRDLLRDEQASQFTVKITIGVEAAPPFQDLCHISHLIGFASLYGIAHERKLSQLLEDLPSDELQMQDYRGDTLMHVACREVAARSVVLLLKHGFTRELVNAPNADGDTPLMCCVKHANRSNYNLACTIIETLAAVGVDVDQQNEKQSHQTALHFAAESDTDGRLLYTLLKSGSNRSLRNDDGSTAEQVALLFGNTKGQYVLETRVQKLAVEYEVK